MVPISPVSSASGMKSLGGIMPSGVFQRSSASTPVMAPSATATFGWKCSANCRSSITALRSRASSESRSGPGSDGRAEKNSKVFLPCSLARYIAMSACLSSAWMSSPSAG
jgi:hypothetical protein